MVLSMPSDLYDFTDLDDFFEDYIQAGKKLPQAFVCANDLIALALLKVALKNKITEKSYKSNQKRNNKMTININLSMITVN